MLADFNLYVKAIKNLMILTDNENATDAKKKALMQSVGGQDIVWLFDYVGKVADEDTYWNRVFCKGKAPISESDRLQHVSVNDRSSGMY